MHLLTSCSGALLVCSIDMYTSNTSYLINNLFHFAGFLVFGILRCLCSGVRIEPALAALPPNDEEHDDSGNKGKRQYSSYHATGSGGSGSDRRRESGSGSGPSRGSGPNRSSSGPRESIASKVSTFLP